MPTDLEGIRAEYEKIVRAEKELRAALYPMMVRKMILAARMTRALFKETK